MKGSLNVVTILFLIALPAVSYAQRKPPTPTLSNRTYTNIRQVDFRNFDYGSGKNLIRIRRGRGGVMSDIKVIYGDVTGDTEEEAVVLLSGVERSGSFGWPVSAGPYVYTLINGHPKKLEEGDMESEKIQGTVVEATISRALIFVRFVISPNGRDMEQTRGLRAFSWSGLTFEKVDSLPPNGTETRYFFRLFNCNDSCSAFVNGNNVFVNAEGGFETNFGEDGGWIDITEILQAGRNQIKFTVNNGSGAIAYGIQVTKNGSILYEKTCGRAGQVGCENNRVFPKGIAREFTYTIIK